MSGSTHATTRTEPVAGIAGAGVSGMAARFHALSCAGHGAFAPLLRPLCRTGPPHDRATVVGRTSSDLGGGQCAGAGEADGLHLEVGGEALGAEFTAEARRLE